MTVLKGESEDIKGGGGAQWQTFGLYVEMAYLYILVHFWSTNMIAVMKADELSIHITL